jgi:hypothetical protein
MVGRELSTERYRYWWDDLWIAAGIGGINWVVEWFC